MRARWAVFAALIFTVTACDDSEDLTFKGPRDASVECETGETQNCTMNSGEQGIQLCEKDAWSDCIANAIELCNGLDDDGDGETDEGLERACSTACGAGREVCKGGVWFGCTAQIPENEICDGLDNDCDGEIDEGLTRICNLGCGEGKETCVMGKWIGCTAPLPTPEICDGLDNDCDDATDENLVRDCEATCRGGVQLCINGVWGECDAPSPEPEICADGIDNDCDGEIDEDCDNCENGAIASCGVDEGVCQKGERVCSEGMWGPCLKNGEEVILPGENQEICDGLDNDCDGATDESFPTQGQECGTNVGVCTAGVSVCSNGHLVCSGSIAPSDEICDGLDNNCDGDTDESVPPDSLEPNETCLSSTTFSNPLPEYDLSGEYSITWLNATLYPSGDEDLFNVLIEENSNWCVPFSDEAPYAVQVFLIPPAGVNYELCIAASKETGKLDKFCSSEMSETYCTCTPDEDGWLTIGLQVPNKCGSNDNSRILMTVRGLNSDYTCSPYRLGVLAYTVTED